MPNLCLHRWLIGAFLAIALLPAISQAAANKIVLVTNDQTVIEGFITALGQTYDPSKVQYELMDSFANDETYPPSLTSAYTIEIESDIDSTQALTQDPDVLALVCVASASCVPASDKSAGKDVLVISLTATSSQLMLGDNILRLAPSNAQQAGAIYKRLKEGVGNGRFAIAYEPNTYALDLYQNFILTYADKVLLSDTAPQLLMGLPLHTDLSLQSEQKPMDASRILDVLDGQALDAVIYLGMRKGFTDLTDSTLNGNAGVAPRWYASDAVHPLNDSNAFAGLEIITLFGAAGKDRGTRYYYAYDAGSFLLEAIKPYLIQDIKERTKLLEIAKTTSIYGSTGLKGFQQADQNSLFSVLIYDNNIDGASITTTTGGSD